MRVWTPPSATCIIKLPAFCTRTRSRTRSSTFREFLLSFTRKRPNFVRRNDFSSSPTMVKMYLKVEKSIKSGFVYEPKPVPKTRVVKRRSFSRVDAHAPAQYRFVFPWLHGPDFPTIQYTHTYTYLSCRTKYGKWTAWRTNRTRKWESRRDWTAWKSCRISAWRYHRKSPSWRTPWT